MGVIGVLSRPKYHYDFLATSDRHSGCRYRQTNPETVVVSVGFSTRLGQDWRPTHPIREAHAVISAAAAEVLISSSGGTISSSV